MSFLHPTYIIALLIAISVHEWSHAIVATKLGDPTPGEAGRLSLNPLAHIDLFGALMFLVVGFGWAKPVPINPMYFRRAKRDICLTAIAGPVSNLILAFFSVIALKFLGMGAGLTPWELLQIQGEGAVLQMFLTQLFGSLLFVNLALMAFNLIPIAPLDGSKVLQAFVPLRYLDLYDDYMRYGMYILVGMFVVEAVLNIPLLSVWITAVMGWTLSGMQMIL